MRVFILEDDPARMLYFRERFIAHDITHAEYCTQIDRFSPPYDVIFLDHDLGGRQMEEHEDDGAAFAKLIKGRVDSSTRIIIHSYNAEGAQRIQFIVGGWMAPFRGRLFEALVDDTLYLGRRR